MFLSYAFVPIAQTVEIPNIFADKSAAMEFADKAFPKVEVVTLSADEGDFLILLQEGSGMLITDASIYKRSKILSKNKEMDGWVLIAYRAFVHDQIIPKIEDDCVVLKGKFRDLEYLRIPIKTSANQAAHTTPASAPR